MYLTRLIEKTIEKKLKSSGAIEIKGPKFCGKTTTSKRFCNSKIQLITDDVIEIVSIDPKAALVGEYPRLIDEWQNVPEIWNCVRDKVDDSDIFGEYILTGSSTPPNPKKIHHSGAGRITPIKMRPLTLYETLESKGSVSLLELFNNKDFSILDLNEDHSLIDTAFYICRGGWPKSLNIDKEVSLDVTKNYYEGLFNFKNSENPNYKRKNPNLLRMILKSYARNISTEASYQTILSDVMTSNSRVMDIKTFESYLEIAEELYIIEDIEAWTPNIRSKAAIRTTNTRHFVDTSIACCALNISPSDLMNDSKSFGFFFEDFAVHELKVYAETIGGEVRHYRDSNGLECDAIVHLNDGRWAAIEIKLGSENGINEGVKNLKALEENINKNYKKPSFKMILTAAGKAYKRIDGIYVIPINLLRN